MSYIASWSGGKDSCFALYKAIGKGCEISHLVNFISEEFHRVSFYAHRVRCGIIFIVPKGKRHLAAALVVGLALAL